MFGTTDLSDPGVVACVAKVFNGLAFPPSDGGAVVVVTYPLVFAPGDSPAPTKPSP